MANTVRDLTFRLWRRLENGDIPDDSRFTYKELSGYIKSAIAGALKANFFENLNANEYRYAGDFTKTTPKTVDTDDNGLQYVNIPYSTIKVPNNNRFLSITSTNPVSRFSVNYIPMREEEVFVAKLQPDVPGVVLFYTQQDKIFFYNNNVSDTTVNVHQKYTIPNDDDADIGLTESENQIIEAALRLLGQPTISDRDNNGVPIS